MNSKKILFSIMLLTTINSNTFAMDNEKFCKMTCHRPSGYWCKSSIKETSPESQREPWHQYTSYIAEPLCTASNIPFFLAAYAVKDSSPLSAAALTFAGSASAISHAIPYQFLNTIDKIGALTSMAAVAYDSNLYTSTGLTPALQNQKILLALAITETTALTDLYVARSKQIVKNSRGLLPENMIVERKPEHQWIHVMWHLLAAWTAYALLTTSC